MSTVGIKMTIRGPMPRIDFEKVARAILGPHYELSLVICGDALARRMNKEHRMKTYTPNVLSFPLSKSEGEIFLNIRKAEQEAKSMGTSMLARVALLYVHGLFHLKGLDHGSKMEREEEKMLRKSGFLKRAKIDH